jgi:hypothetical protein
VIIQDNALVAQLAYQQVLFLDLFLEGERPLQLLLRGIQFRRQRRCFIDGLLVLNSNRLELRLGALDELTEFFLPRCASQT